MNTIIERETINYFSSLQVIIFIVNDFDKII